MLKKPRSARRGRQIQRHSSQLVEGQVLRSPAAAHFHHRHPVALLGEPVRGDAAAEAGANHDEIEIQVCIWHELHRTLARRRRAGTASPHAAAPAGGLANCKPGFSNDSRMDASECLRDFSGLDTHHRPERARQPSEFIGSA